MKFILYSPKFTNNELIYLISYDIRMVATIKYVVSILTHKQYRNIGTARKDFKKFDEVFKIIEN